MRLLCCRGDAIGGEDPFREWCGKVGELRALVSSPLVALTATATKATRNALKSKLGLRKCRSIIQSPDRPNIKLSVRKVSPFNPVSHFASVINELKTKRNECSRLMVYCQKISDCSDFYVEFMGELGDLAYWPDGCSHVSDNRLVSMYHSGTPEYNKTIVLQSLEDPAGVCRVIFATSALGMGIDVKGVHSVVHWGPPSKLEHYMQEIGRCGRDGIPSTAVLLYNGHQLRHCDKHMLQYIKATKGCRREMILAAFDEVAGDRREPLHVCCDLCSQMCSCQCDHSQMSWWPEEPDTAKNCDGKKRYLTSADKEHAIMKLSEIFECVSGERAMSFSVMRDVVDMLHLLFTVDDIINLVGVESPQQAILIFEALSSCFSDMSPV